MIMRIKELREAQNLTQQQLADSMGLVRSAIANWETETALPPARQLPVLARLLNCSINDLFSAFQAVGKGGTYMEQLSYQRQTEIHDKIIRLLAQEHCTVRQAKAILMRCGRTIEGTAAVQFIPGLDYEF